MSQRIRQYYPLLRAVNSLPEPLRRRAVHVCDRKTIDCICECVKNILKGNVPLTARQKVKLRRERNNLRLLALRNTSLSTKKKILQKGGFLSAILGPALSVLGSILLPHLLR
jgi:hypothetical protein